MTTDSTHEAPIVPGEASAEMIEALRAVLKRDAEWGLSGMANDCGCMSLSPDAEREYEMGQCPHQVARALLAATPSAPPADLEAESRELLAAEAARAGYDARRDLILQGCANAEVYVPVALRAIQRALSARQIAQGDMVPMPAEIRAVVNSALAKGSTPISTPSVEADAMVERLRGPTGDYEGRYHAMLEWTGSAFLAGEKVSKAEQSRLKGDLYSFLCSTLGYLLAAEELQQAANEAAALITRLSGGEVERLREALKPFAEMRLSTEPEVSDCLLRSAGADMRRRADALDKRDNDIRRARTAIQGESRD